MLPILSISGSDNSGWSGLQQDLGIIAEMGGHALTSATCIVMQDEKNIREIIDFPTSVLQRQVEQIITDFHPKAVKVGMIRGAESIQCVAREIVGCRKIIVAPGIVSSAGTMLVDDETLQALQRYLIPMANLLVLRQIEAERLLSVTIATEQDMLVAAQRFIDMGAGYVMLRGGKTREGRITALLAGQGMQQFFSSYNIEGWQQHGVGGALSAAIATRMGMGDEVPEAISKAHEYVHSRVVYSVNDNRRLRPADLYNAFMNLLSAHHQQAHDVQFYADRLNISTRYLSQVTSETVSKTPKQIIADYLVHQACQQLENSRLSIKEISDGLGFTTIAMFCKLFKQQQQVTPSEYRMSVKSLS